MLDRLKYINQKDSGDLIGASLRSLREHTMPSVRELEKTWAIEQPTKVNLAKQIAQECMGRAVYLIGPTQFEREIETWRDEVRFSGRALAQYSILPNETSSIFTSFGGMPVEKIVAIVILRGAWESTEYTENVEKLLRLLSGRWPEPEEIRTPDLPEVEVVEWLKVLGALSSQYLGVANGFNPDPTKVLKKL